MKKSTLILLVTCIFFGYNAYPQNNPRMENPDYTVTVFYDDFDGNWRDKWKPSPKQELFGTDNFPNILIWVDSTATIHQNSGTPGDLYLTALGYEDYISTDYNGDPITADYISGQVKSKDRFLHGVFECNATFGYKHGSFPAFWLHYDTACVYDYGSEIDIVELKYEEPSPGLDNHAFYYPCETGGYESIPGSWNDYDEFNWSTETPHTFKCIWTPTKTEWYVDNTKLHTLDNTGNNHYPNKTMAIILSQQLFPYNGHMSNIDVPVTSTFHWVKAKEFFLAPEITVTPSSICTQGIATIDVAPEAYDFSWILSPSYLFSGTKTGTGKTASITAASNVGGQGKIKYTFKMPSGGSYETFTAEKTFWIGKPGTPLTSPSGYPTLELSLGAFQPISLFKTPGFTGGTINWWSTGSIEPVGSTSNPTCTFEAVELGTGNFYVTVTNTCNQTSPIGGGTVNVVSGGGGQMILVMTPNPTTGETILTIESENDINSFDETAEWELEVYDQGQSLKEKKNSLKGKSTKIQTAGWKEGIYAIRVKYKDKILQDKLVVQK